MLLHHSTSKLKHDHKSWILHLCNISTLIYILPKRAEKQARLPWLGGRACLVCGCMRNICHVCASAAEQLPGLLLVRVRTGASRVGMHLVMLKAYLCTAIIGAARCVTVVPPQTRALQQPGYGLAGIHAARGSGGRCYGRRRRTLCVDILSMAPWCAWPSGHALMRLLLCVRPGDSSDGAHGHIEAGQRIQGWSVAVTAGRGTRLGLVVPSFMVRPPSFPPPQQVQCMLDAWALTHAAVRWRTLLICIALVGLMMCS